MEVPLETMANFMSKSSVCRGRASHNRAFASGGVPDGAGHGRGQERLLFTHAFGFGTEISHIISDFPMNFDLVHDPLLGSNRHKCVEFTGRQCLTRSQQRSARQSQDQPAEGMNPSEHRTPPMILSICKT